MGLNKFCCRCDAIISRRDKYCKDCQQEIDKKNKERFDAYLRSRKVNDKDKEVYKKYKNNREDKEYQAFYNSKEWKNKREKIIAKFKYMDIYSYYKNKELVSATLVHHISEVKEDYSRRLDDDNLIAISDRSHSEIHKRMNKSKEEKENVIAELLEMRRKFEEEFGLIPPIKNSED
ncbi:hypothetical protein [Clostridium tertium]|uniref:hypothetical protein n=1 Tax=Clostridium tertium TaxID=1559 RepID=UPI0024B347D7|nr:hypothetical protein [Clostridium tertium]MDI9216009.1 hypothetical protein [Clostridium tertium]